MTKKNIAVIGAGIVGLSTAYYLQSSLNKVTLYDQYDPGSGTSRGHASVIANYGIPALNQNDVWKNLIKYLFYKNSPLSIKFSYLHKSLPWLIHFLRNCNSISMNFTAEQTANLLKKALPTYQNLLNEIQANDLIVNRGVLYVWIDEKEKPTKNQIKIREKNNIEQFYLSKSEILDLEPYLNPNIKGGWYFPKAHHTLNPDKILSKIFIKFKEKNGQFIKEKISHISFINQKFLINSQTYDEVVICCGAFSNTLVKQLEGKSIPLETERGYHLEFQDMQRFLSRPICLVDSGMYLTPLDNCIRAAGTVELAGNSNEINYSRINYIDRGSKRLISELKNYQKTWLGFRPTLPDCLPIIGKSPNHNNLYYAFGHNHLGWTLGPVTGKMITKLINKEESDNQAYKIDRFL